LNHSSDNHGRGARKHLPDGGRCVFDGRSYRGTVMQIVIGNVLSSKELGLVRAALARARFVDGAATAGFAARPVKNNRQAEGSDRSLGTIRKLVAERVLGNEVFRLAVRPKALSPLLFSRYEKGMRYGSHVDDALMDGMRTDVSFTLFLSEPESYDGGELAIEGVSGEETFKLDAGALVAYSATSLHHVTEVTRGARLAAVGWVRSFVRDPARRELLFDLDTARRQMLHAKANRPNSTLSRSHWPICCACGWRTDLACAVATRSTFSNLVWLRIKCEVDAHEQHTSGRRAGVRLRCLRNFVRFRFGGAKLPGCARRGHRQIDRALA
jgi:PKHD-type hydroxylase